MVGFLRLLIMGVLLLTTKDICPSSRVLAVIPHITGSQFQMEKQRTKNPELLLHKDPLAFSGMKCFSSHLRSQFLCSFYSSSIPNRRKLMLMSNNIFMAAHESWLSQLLNVRFVLSYILVFLGNIFEKGNKIKVRPWVLVFNSNK